MRSPIRVSRSLLVAASSLAAAPSHAAADLVLIPEIPILVTLLVGFTILIFPVNALIFRPLLRVLEQRNERIAGARRRADSLHAQADEILGRYKESIADVRDEAEQQRRAEIDAARAEQASITGVAREESLAQVERARDELGRALVDARESMRRSTEELAGDIASQVLGRPIQ